MDKRWMAGYAVVLALFGTACFWDLDGGYSDGGDYSYSYSDDYSDYSREHTDEPPDYSGGDGYHGRAAVRQALTSPAPDVGGPGYDDSGYAWSCEVHAECGPDEVCASDPACPDYLYCYPKQEAACDCADRFNTVCYFGDCVMRGVDCDGGCPAGTTCDANVGACICTNPGCGVASVDSEPEPEPEPEQPTIDAPEPNGEKCLDDSDCAEGSCVNGSCGSVPCWSANDCMREETCELATDGLRYCTGN